MEKVSITVLYDELRKGYRADAVYKGKLFMSLGTTVDLAVDKIREMIVDYKAGKMHEGPLKLTIEV